MTLCNTAFHNTVYCRSINREFQRLNPILCENLDDIPVVVESGYQVDQIVAKCIESATWQWFVFSVFHTFKSMIFYGKVSVPYPFVKWYDDTKVFLLVDDLSIRTTNVTYPVKLAWD